jgi:hypothetical protein
MTGGRTMVNRMPELKQRERDVVSSLCKLLRGDDAVGDRPSLQEITDELVVGKAHMAIHLTNISRKTRRAIGVTAAKKSVGDCSATPHTSPSTRTIQ